MMEYQNSKEASLSNDEILIIGLGGAGTNIINSVSKHGLKNADTLAISADVRALSSCNVKSKVQMGTKFRRGLACGGDPELGLKAAQESEAEIRGKIAGKKIVFLCVGLGGGSGSGASPLITRIAREENAFVVVFATMPFSFEGSRRRYQADNAMNELAAIASALVTFDNGRMAELVSPTDSVHAAFTASNKLISSSILSIARIALYPGIVHIGLDDLVSTLSTKRSRCLFGAGSAKGKNRVEKALKMALASPLIDKGKLLNTSEKVIVHICGGPSTTMEETEQFMSGVVENLGISTEIFFGISIDQEMSDEFSATIISSVPEEQVQVIDPNDEGSEDESTENTIESLSDDHTGGAVASAFVPGKTLEVSEEPEPIEDEIVEPEQTEESESIEEVEELTEIKEEEVIAEENDEPEAEIEFEELEEITEEQVIDEPEPIAEIETKELEETTEKQAAAEERPEPETELEEITEEKPDEEPVSYIIQPKEHDLGGVSDIPPQETQEETESPVRRRFAHLFAPKDSPKVAEKKEEPTSLKPVDDVEIEAESPHPEEEPKEEKVAAKKESILGIKPVKKKSKKEPEDDLFFGSSQTELSLDGQPKGRFEGESPNIYEGADLDVPTFLRTSD